MLRSLTQQFVRRAAPIAALALGTALSGCAYAIDWDDEVEGVEFSELDTAADAPTDIALAGPDKIIITQGDTLEISLDGDEEAGKALRFDRDGNGLTIARETDVYDGSGIAIVRITMPAPEQLVVAGGGTIEAATIAENAELVVGGYGDMTIDSIAAESLEIVIGGSGKIKGAGTTERLEITIGGSGDVVMSDLNAQSAEVSIGGSGDVAFTSNGMVEANIGGSGDIRVRGNAECTLNSMGSGTLTCTPIEEVGEDETEEVAAD